MTNQNRYLIAALVAAAVGGNSGAALAKSPEELSGWYTCNPLSWQSGTTTTEPETNGQCMERIEHEQCWGPTQAARKDQVLLFDAPIKYTTTWKEFHAYPGARPNKCQVMVKVKRVFDEKKSSR